MVGSPLTILVDENPAHLRLDRFLHDRLAPDLSRSRIQKLIKCGDVTLNRQPTQPSAIPQTGDEIRLRIPEPVQLDVTPQSIPLEILYEDAHLLVVNKPPGMVVHPAAGNPDGTLVNALLAHCDDLSGINGIMRPGIVHRLDKNTSGLLIVAKQDQAHRFLAAQLKQRTLSRTYVALVWGHMPADSGTIHAPIARSPVHRKKMAVVEGGREAITHWRVEQRFPFCDRVQIKLETGRTHQIRVHLRHVGHPVFGDPEYGGREKRLGSIAPQFKSTAKQMLRILDRQALHATEIEFVHPHTQEKMQFTSGLPDDFNQIMAILAN